MGDYPAWVCADCGERWGRRECREATWHPDACGICGERKSVAEPRDFGHLRDGWQAAQRKDKEGEIERLDRAAIRVVEGGDDAA